MKKLVLLFVFLILLSSLAFCLELKVTEEHPFYVDNSWIKAGQLQVGDLLTTWDGKLARITNIEQVNQPAEVFNFHVNGFNDYFANSILVHNKPMSFLGWSYVAERSEFKTVADFLEIQYSRKYKLAVENHELPAAQEEFRAMVGETSNPKIASGEGNAVAFVWKTCENVMYAVASVFKSELSNTAQAKFGGDSWFELGRLAAKPGSITSPKSTYADMLLKAKEAGAKHLIMATDKGDARLYQRAIPKHYKPVNSQIEMPNKNIWYDQGTETWLIKESGTLNSKPVELTGQYHMGTIWDIDGAIQYLLNSR